MTLLTAVSTSYASGRIGGVAVLALLLVALVRRMVMRRAQMLAQPQMTGAAVAPVAVAAPDSVAPPDWGPTGVASTASAPARAPRHPLRSKQITDGVATVIVLALLVFGVLNIAHSGGSTSPSVRGTAPVPAAPASPAPGSPAPAT